MFFLPQSIQRDKHVQRIEPGAKGLTVAPGGVCAQPSNCSFQSGESAGRAASGKLSNHFLEVKTTAEVGANCPRM